MAVRIFAISVLALSTLLAAQSPPQNDPAAEARARIGASFTWDIKDFLATYCVSCHGPTKPKSDLNLAQFTTGELALSKPHLWKDCAARIHAHEMPPKKEPKQPTAAERARFAEWVASFKTMYPKDPGPGTIRRLSQVEYANTLADLLGVDPRVADEIPRDQVGAGFNSSIPPLLMEKYLAVADAALDEAIKADQLKLKWPGAASGDFSAKFIAPVEGAYTITVRAAAEKPAGKDPVKLAVKVNGEAVGEVKVTAVPPTPGAYPLTCKLSPGGATLAVAGPKTATVESIEIVGPSAGKQTAAQRRIFVATPSKDLPPRDAARKILEAFARRAFRRPTVPAEIDGLLKVFDLADAKGAPFSESVRLMLKATLVSPGFLFLTPDAGSGSDSPGAVAPLGDHQLASKLSYLFWSTMPDEELGGLADAGRLRDPAVVAAQVRRLIADPRSRALFDGFGSAWLQVDRLADLEVDDKKFPLLAKPVRAAMRDEAAMLFETILRGDRPILEFVDSNYTFMNETLAKVYGMEATVKGPKMTRVTLTDPNRGGILSLPGVLAVTSLPNRTSPVKRGRWVLEQVLGQTTPAPPADVPALEKQDAAATSALNLRARMERHRQNPACFNCHQAIDPLGFGLENFDVAGKWREKDDTGAPVDAKGELPGGIAFSGPAELKKIVLARKDEFCRNLVRRILAYTLCRSLSGYDEVVADEIADEVIRDGYKFQTIWVKVATSYPFLNRRISR